MTTSQYVASNHTLSKLDDGLLFSADDKAVTWLRDVTRKALTNSQSAARSQQQELINTIVVLA